jgi:CheY-like chemotaxis protein
MSRVVIAAVSDLFFASKIRATAEHLGITVHFVRSLETLADTAQQHQTDLVVVDLHSTNLDPIALAKALQSDNGLKSIPLVGFYSHVDTELQKKAKQAGYLVMPRSAFSDRLADVLSGVGL